MVIIIIIIIIIMIIIIIIITRNTFCGTWYLPHSRVHKSMSELCA